MLCIVLPAQRRPLENFLGEQKSTNDEWLLDTRPGATVVQINKQNGAAQDKLQAEGHGHLFWSVPRHLDAYTVVESNTKLSEMEQK
jgi:hypothetical protein